VGPNTGGMSRSVVLNESDLERELLRKSVDTLTAGRHACADCGRTPLVGETLYQYARGIVVCELCKPLRREDPVRSMRVRHSEYGQTVRVTRRAA
jgi:hypothetical protein